VFNHNNNEQPKKLLTSRLNNSKDTDLNSFNHIRDERPEKLDMTSRDNKFENISRKIRSLSNQKQDLFKLGLKSVHVNDLLRKNSNNEINEN